MYGSKFIPYSLYIFVGFLFTNFTLGCGPVKEYPHATPSELLTSVFECVQSDDERGFLTLLPTQEETIAILNAYETDEEKRLVQLDSLQNHWEVTEKKYQVWGEEQFLKLRTTVKGKIDMEEAVLGKARTQFTQADGLDRGSAEATFVSNKTGWLVLTSATRAGAGGNFVLLNTWGFGLSMGVIGSY